MSDRDKGVVEDDATSSANFMMEWMQGSDLSREAFEALVTQAVQAARAKATPDEIEARALLDSFDGRITEIEQRIDRVLARLDAE